MGTIGKIFKKMDEGIDGHGEEEAEEEEEVEEDEEEVLGEESTQELRRSTRTIMPNRRYFNDNTVN